LPVARLDRGVEVGRRDEGANSLQRLEVLSQACRDPPDKFGGRLLFIAHNVPLLHGREPRLGCKTAYQRVNAIRIIHEPI
jgi:hypothetical protein